MDKLDLFWEEILSNIKLASRQALFRQQAELVHVDFNNQSIVISFPSEALAEIARSKKYVISDAIYILIELDFEVSIVTAVTDNKSDDDDKFTNILLTKLENIRKSLLPNQSIICRGWLDFLPNIVKSNE
ncbi:MULTISPECIES: hypothetical protein [unclassified Okeania]|uniref:hypothetical protein n=1 Tax=unclassified Okeania TaxID=2634635 RepID=UPI00142B098B|nr:MULTISPECIES: hypothetical protein [unclassified Okeania]NES88857.1 hypothetical protein [Okeania sp. SIO2B9]NET79732.1 hypothetical protein [Okeania sp. SIO1F9]